jgi:hypothetical protein
MVLMLMQVVVSQQIEGFGNLVFFILDKQSLHHIEYKMNDTHLNLSVISRK